MHILYDFLFILIALFYIPYLTLRRKWHKGFKERLGFIPVSVAQALKGKPVIWIHAVSVGEVLAILDLIKKLNTTFPGHQIVCSTVTKTGGKVAKEELKEKAVVVFAPLDFSPIVRKFISVIHPKIYVVTETEIWPNLFLALKKRKIPIIQINGRISDKAFAGYKKAKFFLRNSLDCVRCYCVQNEEEKARLQFLGVEEERIRVAGNLKFDNVPPAAQTQFKGLGYAPEDILWIAGSTHPGEEEIILSVFKRLRRDFKNLQLVIAPRHVERAEEILQCVKTKGFDPLRLSELNGKPLNPPNVLIVDTMGELRSLYSLARVVFIGKSLSVGGGQSIIEPAFFGKPILVGPEMYNFRDIVKIFLKEGALIQVNNEEELAEAMKKLLNDPLQMDAMGRRAKKLIEQYQGATQRTIEAIGELL